MADLERIVDQMGHAARTAGVTVVTGDTKVVPRGAADKIFINTSGIGIDRRECQCLRSQLAGPGTRSC